MIRLEQAVGITDNQGLAAGPLTFANPVKPSSLILCFMATGGTNTPSTSVTDNQTNTYARMDTTRVATGGSAIETYYLLNAKSNGSTFTVTANFSGTVVGNDMWIAEYSGVNPTVVPVVVGTNGSSTTPNPGTLTMPIANCLVISTMTDDNADGVTISAGAGYQLLASQLIISTRNRMGIEAKIQGTGANTVTPSFTIGTTNTWGASAGIFRPLDGSTNKFTNSGTRPRPFAPGLAR